MQRLNYLLSHYLSKTIRPDEWEELKRLSDTTDDFTFLRVLEQLWNETEYRTDEFPNERTMDDMLDDIRKNMRRRSFRSLAYSWLKIAAMILLPLFIGLSIYQHQDRKQLTVLGKNEITIHTGKGQKTSVTLPDGSTVSLNSESCLSYPQNYGYKNRQVSLGGEAFFEVKKDSTKKFTVHAGGMDIEVLGTEFNVRTYETEKFAEMALVSGRVKVETSLVPIQTSFVEPGEKALYDKSSGILSVQKANIRFDTAWMRSDLVFRSEPLKNVLSMIQRKYGVNIHIEGNMDENDRYTGYFDSDRIDDIMKTLKVHYKFDYEIKNKNVWVYMKNRES